MDQLKRRRHRTAIRHNIEEALKEAAPHLVAHLEQIARLRLDLAEEKGVDPLEEECNRQGINLDTLKSIRQALSGNKGYSRYALGDIREHILSVRRRDRDSKVFSQNYLSGFTIPTLISLISESWSAIDPSMGAIPTQTLKDRRLQTIEPHSHQIPRLTSTPRGNHALVKSPVGNPDGVRSLAHELGHDIHFSRMPSSSQRHKDELSYGDLSYETIAGFNEELARQHLPGHHQTLETEYQRALKLYYSNYFFGIIAFETFLLERTKDPTPFSVEEVIQGYRESMAEFGVNVTPNTHYAYTWMLNHRLLAEPYYPLKYLLNGLASQALIDLYLEACAANDLASFSHRLTGLMDTAYPYSQADAFKKADMDINKEDFWINSIHTLTNKVDLLLKQSLPY